MKEYNHLKIEKKWQSVWEKKKIFQAKDSGKKKFYGLIEFPYPSGDGLHVGHVRSNTAMDIIARKRRMEGYNVLYPIGWDAFGLPTENYAIKTGIAPDKVTKKNTDTFRRQLKSLGFSFDWSREINTTDPKYYKWTQWLFLQFLKHDLAYKAKININWCPKDKIGLANEEVVNGCCERCGTPVEKREKEQWMLRITKYADRLDKDLDTVDYLEKIKVQQRNWIGRSDGAEIEFKIKKSKVENEESDEMIGKIKVFTTRPDTMFGATYLVLAPEVAEGFMIQDLGFRSGVKNADELKKYIGDARAKSEIERGDGSKEKTGVEIKGITAINPVNNEEIPVFIADYVLATYGTGSVMAVPAHDERDFAFAKKYNLPIRQVIAQYIVDKKFPPVKEQKNVARSTVHAIVRNPKTNMYLCLEWKHFPWTTFIVGGVEDGESAIEAAQREVYEETGYKNIKVTYDFSDIVCTTYNAAHKKENRIAYTTCVFFDLVNEEKDEIDVAESDKHAPIWLERKDITEARMTCAELPVWLHYIDTKSTPVYTGSGVLINSGELTGVSSEKATNEIIKNVGGKIVTKFKLRDWVFSRQRYWGEPIPVVHCEKCGIVPLPEKDLPLKLPKVKKYQPTDTGESPLAGITSWVNTKCPKCKGKAQRETDTMPQWAGSSWYSLRYTDPKNSKKFADPKKLKYFTPVDWYNGGMEHTTLHLLYSRFWHKFLYDLELVPTSEPYLKRTSHGMILAGGGEKMSKSKGNVINPDTIVKTYGADTLRMYEMFMGPFDQPIPWAEENIIGVRRFIERLFRLERKLGTSKKIFDNASYKKLENTLHKTIEKVGTDIESMSFNTAISSMMILVNEMEKSEMIRAKDFELLIRIISPFAPHVAEEMWSLLGHKTLVALEKWPEADRAKMVDSEMTIAIQINGKIRAELTVSVDATEAEIVDKSKEIPEVSKWFVGNEVKKVIYVPKRLVNFVIL